MASSSLLIQSLQNPAVYAHSVDYFKVIETHISWVLLTGSYAYKIKKPVNLGFLDFSSLEKRRHACYEELRLNSRLATEIYLDVVAIKGTLDQPSFDGSATTIEYAVKMRQFDPTNTFDQLLARNQLSTEHIKQSADIIATFHDHIASATNDTEFGSFEAIRQPVRENFWQIQQQQGIDAPERLKPLALWSEQQLTELMPVFRQRKLAGFIRECHGDLHLGNIALIDGKVMPFDGIEFNSTLYWIDVVNEIAFLTMDLQEKQRPDLAYQFLNRYLERSGDYGCLKLLRFYQVYRAMVRAKVNLIRACQNASSKQHQQAIAHYHHYLQLANRYTQSSKRLMIIMHGLSGSGKSWLSEQMINHVQAIRLRSDVERKRLHRLSCQQNSHSDLESGLYSQANNDMTYHYLLKLASQILDCGYTVIVDATFLQQQHRALFFKQAQQLQTAFLIVHTQADEQTLIRRINSRSKQRYHVSEADLAVLANQQQKIQPLNNEEQKNCVTVNTNQTEQLTRLWRFLDQQSQQI